MYHNQQLLPAPNFLTLKFQVVLLNDSSLLNLTWMSNYPYKFPDILIQSGKKKDFFA